MSLAEGAPEQRTSANKETGRQMKQDKANTIQRSPVDSDQRVMQERPEQENRKCPRPLARRWSAPMRSRHSLEATCGENQHKHCPMSSLNSIEDDELRHSHRDKSFVKSHHRNHSHQNQQVFRHKSISSLRPTSSSASDSAFSQSQTTLGSDSGDIEGQKSTRSENTDRLSSDDSSSSSGLQQELDHFKLIWRNLSYRIPEKRFARVMSFVNKLKEKWSAGNDNELDHQMNEVDEDYQPRKIMAKSSPDEMAKLESGLSLPPPPTPPTSNQAGGNHLKQYKQRTTIFSNLNGCVRSGQLTAILGPSGAGKTTFLKCLTNSITKGVTGSIIIHNNGGELSSASAKSNDQQQKQLKLCIIPQKDYLFDNLTVMENLLFASRIKNTQANFDHMENVHRIANLLGLLACMKLKTSRLSGGQYKRVSIAQELLSQPDILILDEPTSGLDSLTCFRTVSVLRDLADMSQSGLIPPLAIVMTIHQPQIKIFNLFHHVYVLSALGQCVYEGRPGYLLDTVEDRCKLLPPPDDQNPASFIIDIASEVYGNKPVQQLVDVQQETFSLLYSRDVVGGTNQMIACSGAPGTQFVGDLTKKGIEGRLGASTDGFNDGSGDNELTISSQLRKRHNHEHNFWLHTGLLIKRHWISTWRDSLLTTTRVTFHLIIPLVFYCVYSQKSGSANACPHVEREIDINDMVSDSNIERLTVQHDELILTFENVSLFFILLYSFSMCVLAVTALSFPLNMQILLKETANGWYTMPRFVMAKTLADLPIELTMPMISVSIAYTITGQPGSYMCWRMLAVTAIMTLCSLISQTQGLLYGAYFMNNVQAAVFVSQATTLPWIMLSGFTTRISQLPRLLQWLSFGSIYRLGIESIMTVRYGFGMCPCDEELVNETVPKIVGIPDQLKSVLSYYMGMYAEEAQQEAANSTHSTLVKSVLPSQTELVTSNSSTSGMNQDDVFTKLASTLTRANTYGVNIVSCDDVRPFILTAREVDESTLPIFLSVLFAVLIGLKVLLFYVVRIRTS